MNRKIIIGACALLGTGIIYTSAALSPTNGTEALKDNEGIRYEVSWDDGFGSDLKPFPSAEADRQAADLMLFNTESVAEAKILESTPEASAEPTPSATPKNAPKVASDTTVKTSPKASSKPVSSPKPSTTSRPASASAAKSGGLAEKVVGTARKYMGVPYVWGGTTPSGFDCSGFIYYVYAQNGVALPRTSAEQYGAGQSVSKADLKPGDLVFFETYKPGPSHVGIYLGNGQFIHASSGGGKVLVSNLSSTYYTEHYIGSRRVLK